METFLSDCFISRDLGLPAADDKSTCRKWPPETVWQMKRQVLSSTFTTAFFCKLEACIHEQSCIVGVVVHQSFDSSHFVAKVGWQRRASLLWWWIQRVERFSLGTCHELWYLTFFEAAQCPTAREISAESYEQLSSCGLRLRLPPSPSRFRSESWGLRVDVVWSKQRTCGIELNANFIDFIRYGLSDFFLSCPLNHKQTTKKKHPRVHRPRLCRFAPFVRHHRSGCLRLGARCLPPASPGLEGSTHLGPHEAPGDALALMGVIASIGSNCAGKPGKELLKNRPKRNIHSNYSWQLERYKSF